jgi:hypothetical protein
MPLANTKTLDTSWDHIKIKVLVPLVKNKITRHPMHASTSFHHSSIILAYTTQARVTNLKLVQMQASTCKMHIQMQQSCSWACSPYLCAQILIDPFPMLIVFMFISPQLYLCDLSLPLCQQFPTRVQWVEIVKILFNGVLCVGSITYLVQSSSFA